MIRWQISDLQNSGDPKQQWAAEQLLKLREYVERDARCPRCDELMECDSDCTYTAECQRARAHTLLSRQRRAREALR